MPTRVIQILCYAFMGGIALSMRFRGLGASFGVFTAIALASAGVCAYALARPAKFRRPILLAFSALTLFGLCAGLMRHAAADVAKERPVGEVAIGASGARVRLARQDGYPYRVRVRKEAPGAATLRLLGSLRLRAPVTDDRGAPAMSAAIHGSLTASDPAPVMSEVTANWMHESRTQSHRAA